MAGIRLPAGSARSAQGISEPPPGAVDQSAARRYYGEDREAGFVLLCTARARSDLVLVTGQADAMRAHRAALGLPAPM